MDHPTNESQDEIEGSKRSQTHTLKDSKLEEESSPATRALALETREHGEETPSRTRLEGFTGMVIKAIWGAPPKIWVVNRHVEDITVVVSKKRKLRMIQGSRMPQGGFSTSETTFFGLAATQRRLAKDSMAIFPLWTKKGRFGVISIFTGPDKTLFIENEQVSMGSTVTFVGKPNLEVVTYMNKRELKD